MRSKAMAIVVAREPAASARPTQRPPWVQLIRLRLRRAILRRNRAEAMGPISQWQLQDLEFSHEPAHSVRKAFFNAEAQMGMFR